MSDVTRTIAAAGTEWVYFLLVVAIFVISLLAERVKSAMSRTDRGNSVPPRPATRRHPTSLPRPIIPPFEDGGEGRAGPPPARGMYEGHPRPAVPPVIPRPRPPVRPPAPRPAGAAPELNRPGPQPRSVEERKAVIRGQAPPPRSRPSQVPPRSQPVPPPAPAEEPERWARLTEFGEQVSAGSKLVLPERALKEAVSAGTPSIGKEGAESFRHLTPADLQRAFVLKEILEPPLALRD